MNTVHLTFVACRNAISDSLADTHTHTEKKKGQWTSSSAVHQPRLTVDMTISVPGLQQAHSET